MATSQSAEVYPISPGQKELFLRGRRGGGLPLELSFTEHTLGTWIHTAGVSRNCGCGLMGLGGWRNGELRSSTQVWCEGCGW